MYTFLTKIFSFISKKSCILYVKKGSKLSKLAKQHGYFTLPVDKDHTWHHCFLEYSEEVEIEHALRRQWTGTGSSTEEDLFRVWMHSITGKNCFHTQTSIWDYPWMLWPLGRVNSVSGQSLYTWCVFAACHPKMCTVKIFCSSIRLRFPSLWRINDKEG